jgi:hypothetical protein
MLHRVTLQITLDGRRIGSHDLTVDAPDRPAAELAALASARDDYDERHALAVTRCREIRDERENVKP